MSIYEDYTDFNIHLEDCAEHSSKECDYYLTKSEKEVDRLAQMRLPKEAPTGMWSSFNQLLKDGENQQQLWESLWGFANLPSYKTESQGFLSLAGTAFSLGTNYSEEAKAVFEDFNRGKPLTSSLKDLGLKAMANPQDLFNITQLFMSTGTTFFAANAVFNIVSEAFNKKDSATASMLRQFLNVAAGHPACRGIITTYHAYNSNLDKANSKKEVLEELKLSNKHKDTINELKSVYKVQNEAMEMLRRQIKKDQELQQFLRKTFNR